MGSKSFRPPHVIQQRETQQESVNPNLFIALGSGMSAVGRSECRKELDQILRSHVKLVLNRKFTNTLRNKFCCLVTVNNIHSQVYFTNS